MKKTSLFAWYTLILTLMLCACSINVSQPPQPTPTTASILPMTLPTSTVGTVQTTIGNPSLPSTTIPVTWGDLNVSGKLVYINAVTSDDGNPIFSIQALDLATGAISTIFQGTDLGWIYYMSVSPDEKHLVMSYSVPSPNNSSVNALLYTLPLDGSTGPQLLIQPPSNGDQYNQAEWSPDGKYIYYVHFNGQNQPLNQHYPIYEIYRMAYPDGQPEKIADQAFWPRLSADGSRLVYISMDPGTGLNKIFLANADGSGAQEVTLTGSWTPDIIDAPIFSPDGQPILFSAISPQQSSAPTWLEKVFGVQIAEAHSVPSDWFSVPLAGGDVTRLTTIQDTSLFASISPDKRLIASYSGGGIFVMNPDGTNLNLILPDSGGVPGTVNWIP